MLKSMICVLFLVSSYVVSGQERAVVSTAVPFLNITPDACGGGMGETGVATRADVYSMFYNAAKYAFAVSSSGVAFSYVPWMRDLIKGQNLYILNVYHRIDSCQVLALGVRYFQGKRFFIGDEKFTPADYAVDLAYSRCLGKGFSAALTVRYVHTRLGKLSLGEVPDTEPSGAVSFDVSAYYQKYFASWQQPVTWRVGLSLSNAGTKVASFTEKKDGFQPAYLRLGSSLETRFEGRHTLTLALEIGKLLVRAYDPEKAGESVLKSMAGAFGNSGFRSVVWQVGGEYSWRQTAFFRTGYFHESEMYGDRQYVTLGVGGAWRGWILDFSYLFPTNEKEAPYKNTFRLSLGYNF